VFDNTFNGTSGSGTGANKIVLHNNNWLAGFGLESGAVTYHSGDEHRFYTGANNTTTYGTLRLSVTASGMTLSGTATATTLAGSLNASWINAGTLAVAQLPAHDASWITSGTFAQARIPALDASWITAGTLNGARIPQLNASHIPLLNASHVPSLDAGKITTGTFAQARIPALDASWITAGTFLAARIPTLNQNTTGNAATATTLQTARNINGTSFNGSADITTANWGTGRTLTIGSTGKSVNGSADVSWSLAEIGAAATGHNHLGLLHRNSVVNDANTALTEGTYGFGADSGLLNYPWASGYGKLEVVVNNGDTHNNVDNWIWQVINDTSGRRYSRYKVNAGGWTSWTHESTTSTWHGNAGTATTLQTARNINGTSFNGSADITTANWGTGRTLTIGSTGKSVNGSAAVSWTLAEIGAAAIAQTMHIGTTALAINRASAGLTLTGVSIDGNAGTASTLQTARTFTIGSTGRSFNGSAAVSWSLADIGAAAIAQTMHIGTTALAINRASAGLTLTGVSIDGNAGTASTLQTARTFTIGSTGRTFNGSADVSWSLADIGAAASSHTHNISGITDANRWWNNFGDNHTTRTDFNATYDFGWRFIQGSTNGPGVNSAGQYYSVYVGLGNEYPATGVAHGMQIAYPRNVSLPYIAIRYRENSTTWGSWNLTSAGRADVLTTARNINGTSFNGSADITTANWGTGRTLTIGSTGKSVNGSADVSWSLAEIGAAAIAQTMHIGTTALAINRASAALTLAGVSIDGNAGTATTLQTARTFTIGSTGRSFNGSAAVTWSLADIGAAAIAQTMHIGTTALAINRASAGLTLTGVSIDGNAGTVTNGVYTSGDQDIGGTKKFTGRVNVQPASSGGGQNLFNGLDAISTANGRAQLVLSSAYSDLVIASSQSNANGHGSTLSFTTYNPSNAADYRKMVIGQGNWGSSEAKLFFGYGSNTPNPHSTFSASSSILTIDGANRRVGIEQPNPAYTLDVSGNGRFTSDLQTAWINTTSGDRGNTTPSRFYASDDAWLRFYTRNTYKMHIGLTAKYDRGRVQDTTDTNYWVGTMGWGTTDWNTVATWGSGFVDSWSSPANRPGDSTHHVGIQAFHYSAGANVANGWQLVGGPTDTWSIRRAWSTWGSWFTLLHSGNFNSFSPTLTGGGASGTWGINVTGNAGTVTNGVYTTGNQSIGGVKTFTSNVLINYNNPTIVFQDTDHNSGFWHCNSNLMYLLRGGNNATSWTQVGGQWPFIFNLTNNNATCGNEFFAVGNITAYSSDKRLKTNVRSISNALDKVSKLNGVIFDWIPEVHDMGFHPLHMTQDAGLLAQEVQDVLHQAVAPAPFDRAYDSKTNTYKSKSGQDYLTVQYEKVVPLLVEAIKELKTEKDDEIKRLREENEDLRRQNESILNELKLIKKHLGLSS
jgi:hypothetical protein